MYHARRCSRTGAMSVRVYRACGVCATPVLGVRVHSWVGPISYLYFARTKPLVSPSALTGRLNPRQTDGAGPADSGQSLTSGV